MKILITGASGIVGRYLLDELLRAGHHVFALSRNPGLAVQPLNHAKPPMEWLKGDVLDIHRLDELLPGMDVLIHAAGLVSFQPADEKKLMQVNLQGTANVVNACLAAKCRLLYISSVACLSPGRPMPCEVDERSGFHPDRNTSPYAMSKYLAELEVFRGIEEGLQAAILNPSIVLAPGKEGESSAALVRYAMKPRLFQPSGWLNYIDARDLASVASQILEMNKFEGKRMIVCAGHVSYKDFFERIASFAGNRSPLFTAGPFLTSLAWRFAAIISMVTKDKPLLTRFTAASSSRKLIYSTKYLQETLPGFAFRSISESLQWILVKND